MVQIDIRDIFKEVDLSIKIYISKNKQKENYIIFFELKLLHTRFIKYRVGN